LNGGAGADTYLHRSGSGNDLLRDYGAPSETDTVRLLGISASNVTLARLNNNLAIIRSDTGERITVEDQFYSTNYGIESISFDNGTSWDRAYIAAHAPITGTSGNDTLTGTSGDDVFIGGLGNDTIRSGAGSDTHIYAAGDGNDLIDEESGSTSEVDVLKFTDLNPADVTLTKSGVHLLINVIPTGAQITLDEQFYSTAYWGIEQVQFANGTVWDRAYLAANAVIRGTSGADTLSGSNGDDIFNAGQGNDTIRSGAGSDTHIYALGDGTDLLDEESGSTSEIDTLRFTDLNPADITLTRSGVHLWVNITATGDHITLDEQYWNATQNWGVDRFEFANGTVWNRDQIMQNAWTYGTSGNDNISGWASFDSIDGGAGNDTINGNAGIDRIVGGAGNDTLTGGANDDTFIFHSGFGQDTITDFVAGASANEFIEFDAGIFANYASLQSAMQQVGSDVQITADVANSVLLKNVVLANLTQGDFHFV
jgi:Ca2+-binding RTX toxin-like protein